MFYYMKFQDNRCIIIIQIISNFGECTECFNAENKLNIVDLQTRKMITIELCSFLFSCTHQNLKNHMHVQ